MHNEVQWFHVDSWHDPHTIRVDQSNHSKPHNKNSMAERSRQTRSNHCTGNNQHPPRNLGRDLRS